jgi:ZIP family zinc transporter
MIAASVWSLLIPALECESVRSLGTFSFLPAVIGLWLGITFLLLMDKILPEPNISSSEFEKLKESKMLVLSVALHNLPEGMAVGVVYAALLSSGSLTGLSGALALSLGIAVQNFPEGAIVSMPLASDGVKKGKAFICGVLSGAIEPIGAIFTLLAISFVIPLLPYLLGFAAGAMIYAVIKELSPIITEDSESNIGIISFGMGFSFMMILDVALG